jgi:2'-5' RNA ligase
MRPRKAGGKPRGGVTSLRLFVAVYPPISDAQAMLAQVDRGALPAGASVATAELVYCTLAFIGETPVQRMGDLIESVDRAAAGFREFSLTPTRLVTLPLNKPARMLAMLTDAPAALVEIQKRLAQRLVTVEDRKRAFLPHFTLARYDIQRPAPSVDREVQSGAASFTIPAVRLMSSHLGPAGVVHRLEHERVLE